MFDVARANPRPPALSAFSAKCLVVFLQKGKHKFSHPVPSSIFFAITPLFSS